MAIITVSEAKTVRRWTGRAPAAPKVGDDSIGWKACRAVAASNIRLQKTPLMRQVCHQGGRKRTVGVPPKFPQSIDFSSGVQYGRPKPQAQ